MSSFAAPAGTTVEAWRRRPGLAGRLADTSHLTIGTRLVAGGFGFFALAGLAAMAMRLQLVRPDQRVIGPSAYEQLFTVHGTSMLLLFTVPAALGFGVYLVPLWIGARGLALPRLAAFGSWAFILGGLTLWVSLALGQAPASGWFNTMSLASPRYEPGFHGDVYAATVVLSQTGMVAVAISLLTTVLTRRAPGMRWHLVPLPVWATMLAAAMVVLALPVLIADASLLTWDSKLGTHFFAAASGGDPLLWQHLFWFFGHPLVYLILLPGLAAVSAITTTFSRHPMVGYPFVVASYMAIAVISFCVWMHHMYTTGRPPQGLGLFEMATLAIVIPSGVHVFSTLATLWHGHVRFSVPLLYVLGFLGVFVFGGISGVHVASIPMDWQVHDTYYVVAHFHFVLLGGVVLPLLGGLYYWYPKATGWLLDDRLGVAAFALQVGGIVLTFFPMHVLGLEGMPRRVWTYPQGIGWDELNVVASVGGWITGLGMLLYAVNLLWSIGRRPAGPDPWGSATLEWATESPPPPHSFDRVPVVSSRYPLWEQRSLGDAEASHGAGRWPVVLGTSPAHATPQRLDRMPAPSLMPLVAALAFGVAIVGGIFDPLLLGAGLVLLFLACAEWVRTDELAPLAAGARLPDEDAAALAGARTPLWWGTLFGLAALWAGTAAVLASWWYLADRNPVWPIPPVSGRPLLTGVALTLLLGGALAAVELARRALRGGRGAVLPLAAAAGAAVLFVGVQVAELVALDYDQAENASASAEWALSWSFALLVAVLGGACAVAAARARRGTLRYDGQRSLAMYAAFLGLQWPLVALTVYVATRVV